MNARAMELNHETVQCASGKRPEWLCAAYSTLRNTGSKTFWTWSQSWDYSTFANFDTMQDTVLTTRTVHTTAHGLRIQYKYTVQYTVQYIPKQKEKRKSTTKNETPHIYRFDLKSDLPEVRNVSMIDWIGCFASPLLAVSRGSWSHEYYIVLGK